MGGYIQWSCLHFAELTATRLYQALRLRDQVFVLEQQCLYGDIDGLDIDSHHVLAQNGHDELLAYARLLPPGKAFPNAVAVGRVVIAPAVRGSGLGRALMEKTLEYGQLLYPGVDTMLSAQSHLVRFYQSLGFASVSEPYDDVGILHVDMKLAAVAE